MTDKRGGYRKPDKPAPVSGPGRLSKRTDGGPAQKVRPMTGGKYGESQELQAMQQAAPMAANDQASQPAMRTGGGPPPEPVNVIPFGAPSDRPEEPITAGAPMGAGPGVESMGLTPQDQQMNAEDAKRLSEHLPALEFLANRPGASAAMRAYVRMVKSLNVI